MKIVVLANDIQKSELLQQGQSATAHLFFAASPADAALHPDADACIDLLFQHDPVYINQLISTRIPLIIVNDVLHSLSGMPAHVARINAWPGFLQKSVIEVACADTASLEKVITVFTVFNKKAIGVADIPGLLTARVIATVINEAYLGLQEELSTPEEIDTAMKLGTNYPFGPFEWSQKIGLPNLASLLTLLARENSRYTPAPLLLKKAGEIWH